MNNSYIIHLLGLCSLVASMPQTHAQICYNAGVIPSDMLDNGATGNPNAFSPSDFILRGSIMGADANYRGALNQLRYALNSHPECEGEQKALIEEALASLHVENANPLYILNKYLEKFPYGVYANDARLAIANLFYDHAQYAKAIENFRLINERSLDPRTRELYLYHTAYCNLRVGNVDNARNIFTRLCTVADYASAANFYLGYIAYAAGDYSEAENRFDKVVASGTNPSALLDYYLCQINYHNEKYDLAAKQAQSLLQPVCGIPEEFRLEAMRIAGESLCRQGRESQGVKMLREYIAQAHTPVPSALYFVGVNDYSKGAYDEAIRCLEPVVREDNTLGQCAYFYIGQSYLQLNNYNAATVALEKAYRLNHNPQVQELALYNLAVARSKGGKVPFGSSVSLFEEFLQRFPNSPYATQVAEYVINGYLTDSNYNAALDAIAKIRKPDNKIILAKQNALYNLGLREMQAAKYSAAKNHLSQAVEMQGNPDVKAEATLLLGEALLQLDDNAKAASFLNKYLKLNRGSSYNRAIAFYDLGYARFNLKKYSEAAIDFSKFLSINPDKSDKSLIADAYNRLADCNYYNRNFTQAAENYAAALNHDPRRGDYPSYQIGMMKGLQRDYQGKIDALNQMYHTFPTSSLIPSTLLEIGESYGELGRRDRAIETYTLLSTRFPDTSQGRQGQLLLAITYLNEGKRDTAIQQYKKVISKYPTSEQAQVAADDLKQLYADLGMVSEYAEFMHSIPNAPTPETSELAALTLESAQKSLDNNRLRDALKLSSEVVEKYPDSPQAVEALAIKASVLADMGDAATALDTYNILLAKASSPAMINTGRLGMMRVSRDMAHHDMAMEMADKLIASADAGTEIKNEAIFTKALSLRDSGQGEAALEEWQKLTSDPDNLYGAKSAYYIALFHYENGNLREARTAVDKLIEANPPHDYWLAKGFILLSDILRKEGKTFEADEYLRSLKENYPGSERDIFDDILSRLPE